MSPRSPPNNHLFKGCLSLSLPLPTPGPFRALTRASLPFSPPRRQPRPPPPRPRPSGSQPLTCARRCPGARRPRRRPPARGAPGRQTAAPAMPAPQPGLGLGPSGPRDPGSTGPGWEGRWRERGGDAGWHRPLTAGSGPAVPRGHPWGPGDGGCRARDAATSPRARRAHCAAPPLPSLLRTRTHQLPGLCATWNRAPPSGPALPARPLRGARVMRHKCEAGRRGRRW